MDKKVYEKLKDVARKKGKYKRGIITYLELVSECNLKLDLTKVNDRNELSEILGEISKYEVEQGESKAMLSAVVILKQSPLTPGRGFFTFADKLKIREKGESDIRLWARQLQKSYEYWKNH